MMGLGTAGTPTEFRPPVKRLDNTVIPKVDVELGALPRIDLSPVAFPHNLCL